MDPNVSRTSSYRRAVSGYESVVGARATVAVRVLPTSDGDLREEAVIVEDKGTDLTGLNSSSDAQTADAQTVNDIVHPTQTTSEDFMPEPDQAQRPSLQNASVQTDEPTSSAVNISKELMDEPIEQPYDDVAEQSDDEDTLVEDTHTEENPHIPLGHVYSVLENKSSESCSRSSTLTSASNLPEYDDPYKSAIEFPDEIDGKRRERSRSDTLNPYEPVLYGSTSTNDGEGCSGSSSEEFELMDDGHSSMTPVAPESKRKSKSILDKLNFKTSKKRKSKLYMKSFHYDTEKHPPPVLKPQPEGLTDNQIKRRHVVGSIVDIENSYVESLIRLIEKYKKPLIEDGMISQDKAELIFYKIEDILEIHLSFQIALQASISEWDENELIGPDFCCFSKGIVLDGYSLFVNNFIESSDLMRKLTADKAEFRDFINRQAKASPDNLPPHGLMIKIIQRFPQYILQIRDLLKYTGSDHPDYVHLTQALTTLENLAYQLNEGKRQSEYKLAGLRTIQKLGIRNMDSSLLRQDDVSEVVYGPNGEMTLQKNRRLLLFEDQICCVRIDSEEKLTLKWRVKVSQMDYHEVIDWGEHRITEIQGVKISSPMSPNNPDFPSNNNNNVVSEVSEKLKAEFNELIHDQSVLGKIQLLMSSLKQDYKELSTSVVQDYLKTVTTSIKLCEEQMTMLDSCTICVSIPPSSLGRTSPRTRLTFQVRSPEIKQDWVLDFRAIKLATEKVNKNLWIGETKMLRPPLLIRTLELNPYSKHNQSLTLECAVPVYISGASGSVGLQYLWVCSSTDDHGYVTLVSLHSNKPHIIQSFKASDLHINGCCLVPSSIHSSLDHVWISTIDNQISVFSLRNPQKSNILRQFEVPSEVRAMRCIGNHVFIGLSNGTIMKYAKRKGTPLYDEPVIKVLSSEYAVNAIVPLSDKKILTGCGHTFYIMSTLKHLAVLETHTLNDMSLEINKIISIGNGYWFSCVNDPSIRLVHSENFTIPAQERDIGATLSKISGTDIANAKDVRVTALASSQGILWVGVNTGHILTLPMPVLDGIPLSSGPISLCSQKHNGPVKFIIPTKCSLTFAPKSLDELLEANGSYSNSEVDSTSFRSSVDSLNKEASSKRSSLGVFTSKVKDKLSALGSSTGLNRVGKSKPSYTSSNIANRPGTNLTRSSDVFGSLMRIDDINEHKSTLDLINTLVPVNGSPTEKVFTVSQLSSQRGGSLKVTKSSSISDLTPNNLKDFNTKRKHVAQSMLALNFQSSSNPESSNDDQLFQPKQLGKMPDQDALLADMNLELKQRLGNLGRRPNMSALSMGSMLSEVAEDEEEIIYDEYGSGMSRWSDDDGTTDQSSITSDQDDFESSFESSGDLLQSTEENLENESHAAYVETNFLKATIIISGGKGLTDTQLQSTVSEPSLILWQQSQT